MADALPNLATTLALGAEKDMKIPAYGKWVVTPSEDEFVQGFNAFHIYEVEKEYWRHPLIDYLKHGKLPNDARHKMEIQRRAPRFLYYNNTLIFIFSKHGATKSVIALSWIRLRASSKLFAPTKPK